MQRQLASGGTEGWFDCADSECRPSSAESRDERAGGNLPLPGRSKEIDPVRLVQHRDELTSTTASRLVSGNLLQFESLKRSRNGVLSDVVRGGFPGEIVELVMRQPRWQILRHVVMVVGVGTGLAALYRNSQASIRAGRVGG